VVLAVADEGIGIEPYVLEKLGTPFFTTKLDGTGLGLAVCEGIISRHNAKLKVETSDKGSTFHVYFNTPAAEQAGIA
jgi:signal transduction histidine kinase